MKSGFLSLLLFQAHSLIQSIPLQELNDIHILTQANDTDLSLAQSVADAMNNLALPINYYALGVAPDVLSGLEDCIDQDNNIAVLGYVLANPG